MKAAITIEAFIRKFLTNGKIADFQYEIVKL